MKTVKVVSFFLLLAGLFSNTSHAAAKLPEKNSSSSSTFPSSSGSSTNPEFQVKMDQLMTNSKIWQSFSQVEKLQAVEFIIQFFKVKQNIAILKPAGFYAQQLDQNFMADPEMMSLPFPIAVKVLAVMEYDFYNGQDKEQLATETLGAEIAEQIKAKRKEFGL